MANGSSDITIRRNDCKTDAEFDATVNATRKSLDMDKYDEHEYEGGDRIIFSRKSNR